MLSKKDTFKHFIRHKNRTSAFLVSLCIKLPQKNGYTKYFKDNKCINLLVHDKELLKKYNKI